jgi:hypothetical protein
MVKMIQLLDIYKSFNRRFICEHMLDAVVPEWSKGNGLSPFRCIISIMGSNPIHSNIWMSMRYFFLSFAFSVFALLVTKDVYFRNGLFSPVYQRLFVVLEFKQPRMDDKFKTQEPPLPNLTGIIQNNTPRKRRAFKALQTALALLEITEPKWPIPIRLPPMKILPKEVSSKLDCVFANEMVDTMLANRRKLSQNPWSNKLTRIGNPKMD